MKLIREVQSVAICQDEVVKNEEFSVDVLDNEPGYFKNVIYPMLAPGHEVELINWLKIVGLIPQMQTCRDSTTNDNCKRPMSWTPTKGMDNFMWKCQGCRKRRGIRENSIFQDIKCTFKDAIRSVLGWCKGTDVDTMSKILNVRKQVVNSAFNVCARIAKDYIEAHRLEWQLGGPGIIVIIDVYPEGCEKVTRDSSYKRTAYTPILCLAEVKDIPPRYWFRTLNRYHTSEQIHLANEVALQTIKEIVRPGSILVCDLYSQVCSFQSLQVLKHLYPIIVSTNALSRHDNEDVLLIKNLETIWGPALNICQEAQLYNALEVPFFFVNQLWRQRFGNEAFEVLINLLYIT